MKKLLAMALAIATVASYAIVGASAAEFKDESSITHKEAVQVLNATGVLIGDNNGNFNPSGALDRASAAKIIAYLDIGERSAESMPEQQIFDDVPASHWASKYIGYCYTAGYISGDGQGHFFPDQQLDSYSFGKMLQTLLGYDAQIEGLVGDQWKLKIAALSSRIDLTDDVNKVGSEVLTREEGAQMAFNALKANMVEYTNKGTTISVGDGATVSVGASTATPMYSTENYATAIKNDEDENKNKSTAYGRILQLGEKLYKGELKKNGISDDLGRKSDQWVWKSETIGEYVNTPDNKVVVSKADQTLNDVLGDVNSRYRFEGSTEFFVHGVQITSIPTTSPANTFAEYIDTYPVYEGAIVEIEMEDGTDNSANEVDRVTVYYYTSEKVDGTVQTRGSGDTMEVRVPGVYSGYVKADKVYGYEGLQDGDIVYFTVGKNNNKADGTDVYRIYKANKVEGQLTREKKGSGSTPTKYVINGTDYVLNAGVVDRGVNPSTKSTAKKDLFDNMWDSDNFNTQYAYYLDDNGYIVYAKKLEDKATNFSALEDVYLEYSGRAASVTARVVHQDGVVEQRKLKKIEWSDNVTYDTIVSSTTASEYTSGQYLAFYNSSDSTGNSDYINDAILNMCTNNKGTTGVQNPQLFSVKVNSSGEFELKKANYDNNDYNTYTYTYGSATTKLDPGTGQLAFNTDSGVRNYTVNNSTVFVVRKNTDKVNENPTYAVYTGKNNAPTFLASLDGSVGVKYVASVKDSTVSAVYFYDWDSKSGSGNNIFVVSNENVGRTKIGDDSWDLWTVVRDGQLVEIPVDVSSELARFGGVAEISPSYNDDGVLDDFETSDGNVAFGVSGKEYVKGQGHRVGSTQRYVSELTGLYTDYAYGYKMEDGALMVGKSYDKSDYSDSFDISSRTPVIYKNTDGNYSLVTMADVNSKDDNDQVYVICTDDDAKEAKYVLIIEREGDNKNVTGIYYHVDGDTTLRAVGNELSTSGKFGKDYVYDYTMKTSDAGVSTGYVMIETEAGVKVEPRYGVSSIRYDVTDDYGLSIGDGHVWQVRMSGNSAVLWLYSTDDPNGNNGVTILKITLN